MIVLIKFRQVVDADAIYKMCKPTDKRKCNAEIRTYVNQLISFRASCDDGWEYPSSELIAGHLINSGYATHPQ
jgi:hypothetical protein